jgi:Fur family transcriptional regulator, peroxide stress response regulator
MEGPRMTVPVADTEKRLSILSEALRSRGLRLTHQRLEVAREVAGNDTHPDVESIYRGVRERVPTISLDTVYRTVAALAEMALLSRVNATAGATRYDANLERHHHFVCTRCGLIRDVYSASLDAIEAPEEASAVGVVESMKVQLNGRCKECARKESDVER